MKGIHVAQWIYHAVLSCCPMSYVNFHTLIPLKLVIVMLLNLIHGFWFVTTFCHGSKKNVNILFYAHT